MIFKIAKGMAIEVSLIKIDTISIANPNVPVIKGIKTKWILMLRIICKYLAKLGSYKQTRKHMIVSKQNKKTKVIQVSVDKKVGVINDNASEYGKTQSLIAFLLFWIEAWDKIG